MKKFLAGSIAGVAIAISGTAVAGSNSFWEHHYGTNYACGALNTSAMCVLGSNDELRITHRYNVLLNKGRTLYVYYGKTPIFDCHRNDYYGDPSTDCYDLRQ